MRCIRLWTAYDGTDFAGFQVQPAQRTVQGVLQGTLEGLVQHTVSLQSSGRTDAGVHARGQICHFMTGSPIPPSHYAMILRRSLPPDVVVRGSCQVPNHFHSRFDARWKWYRYLVTMQTYPLPQVYRFAACLPLSVDEMAMRVAALHMKGEHDFTAFCASSSSGSSRIRVIYACRVRYQPPIWQVDVVGNGFLHRMVRILVGTLYYVGLGRIAPEDITSILRQRERCGAGPTLPARGLCLMKVGYRPWFSL
ncbi:tRNA pseudouridine(38-40) synthase TruA [Pasteuria penetrans]|uniref:tRNA pseudouridine(38-40) synthase TruA n=1 Tax=Pasteuria penetrans TaxID=86005 RepID=UPI001FEA995E|nr:tRNA pseudouridine(38-40) synthase TruA [Pasteuria penetrans]